jgi:hypothetical protein
MAESKRTFQAARMNKDIEEKILKPGEYRDALNVSVDFSEDGNIGAIENLKGNELLAGQDILGLSSSSNPNAKVIGSIAHPEEEKIYFFVTGDKMDGIFEYDLTASSNQTKPIVLDSTSKSEVEATILTFSQVGVSAAVAQDGSISLARTLANTKVYSNTNDFSANTTGSAVSRNVTARVVVPNAYKNAGEMLIGTVTASQPSITAPGVVTQNIIKKSTTTATLAGSLTNDSVNVTAQGFYYGFKTASDTALTISELVSGGTGITRFTVTNSNVRNNFTKDITGLTANKLTSYAAFATNSVGTTNANVKTFTTDALPPVNRVSGSEYFLFPNIVNGNVALGNDDVDARNIGYGTFYKATGTSLDYKTFFLATGPSNTGQYANRATGTPSFSVTPSGPSFSDAGFFNGIQAIRMHGTTIDTSYQVTISGISGFNNKTFRVNVGSPSGTFHTSTLNLSLGTGIHVASANIGGLQYNVATSSGGHGPATFVLGPVQSGEKMACCIPLNNTATTFTTSTAQSFVSSFNPSNLSVTVTGKTEGTDFDYYVENTSTAIFGNVPGIIFEGTPSLLGSNPTVNINYTT